MHPEPESTSSPDLRETNAEISSDSQTDLSFLDLDLTESPSPPSADEAAAAIDIELDKAAKRSVARRDPQRQDRSISKDLFADRLQEETPPSPSASDLQSAEWSQPQ